MVALLVLACGDSPEQERVAARFANLGTDAAETTMMDSSDSGADDSSAGTTWSPAGDTGDTGGGLPQAPPPHEAPGYCLYQGGNVANKAQLMQKSCGAGYTCPGPSAGCSKGLGLPGHSFYRCGCAPIGFGCSLDALPGWVEMLSDTDFELREIASGMIGACCMDFAYRNALNAAFNASADPEARARLQQAAGKCTGKLDPCAGKAISFSGGGCTYTAMAIDPQPVYSEQKTFCSFKNGVWMIQAAVNCGPPTQGTLRPDLSSTSLGPNVCAAQAARPANASPWSSEGGGLDLILPDLVRFHVYHDAPVPNVAVQDKNLVPEICSDPKLLYAAVIDPKVAANTPLCPGVLFGVPLAADVCTKVPKDQAGTPVFVEDQIKDGGLKPGDGD